MPPSTIDFRLRKGLVATGIVLLFLPKMNLVNIPGQSAGLRIDDILLFGFAVLLGGIGVISGRWKLDRVEQSFLILMGLFLASNLVNQAFDHRSNALYTIRYFEYFLFYYFGYYFRGKLTSICFALFAVNALVMLLQQAGWVGGFASGGFEPFVEQRPYGLTGGPWEVGTVFNIIFAVLVFSGKFRPVPLFILTLPFVLLSGARSPTATHLIILAAAAFALSRHKVLVVIRTSIVAGLLVGLLIAIPNAVTERSEKLFAAENMSYAQKFYERIDTNISLDDLEEAPPQEEDADLSWLARIAKWMYVVKKFVGEPSSWLLGFGPGVWGIALDGGWLRLVTETGICGLVAFLYLFRQVATTPAMKAVIAAMYLNMIFIDIHLSYKTMSLVFFVAGASVLPRPSSRRVAEVLYGRDAAFNAG